MFLIFLMIQVAVATSITSQIIIIPIDKG